MGYNMLQFYAPAFNNAPLQKSYVFAGGKEALRTWPVKLI